MFFDGILCTAGSSTWMDPACFFTSEWLFSVRETEVLLAFSLEQPYRIININLLLIGCKLTFEYDQMCLTITTYNNYN